MKKIPLFIAFIPFALLMACDKNTCPFGDCILPEDDHFTFSATELTVNVDENTTSFDLTGELAVVNDKEVTVMIEVIRENTTAILNQHYTLPDDMTFLFPANSTEVQSLKIPLSPENITSNLTMTFYAVRMMGVDYDEKLTRTITVILTPIN